MVSKTITLLLFISCIGKVLSQPEKGEKNPTLAALLSIFPGGGQIYNGQIWKVPIFWGALATTTYAAYYNYQKFSQMKQLYIQSFDTTSQLEELITQRLIYEKMMNYRRWFEVSVILSVIIYAINIGDAYVHAHLHLFKKIEKTEISLNWQETRIGLKFTF